MNRKAVSRIVLTMLLLGTSTLAFNIQSVKSEPTTWYVDDDGPADFSSIQEAVDHAIGGDTIFVKSGIYNEHVFIDKPNLHLVGEHRNSTLVSAPSMIYAAITVRFHADNILVSGFLLQDGLFGVSLMSDNNTVTDNIIRNNVRGVNVLSSGNTISYNIIANNSFDSWSTGVRLQWSSHNQVFENNIVGHIFGVWSKASNHNEIADNTIHNNQMGIRLWTDVGIVLRGNEIWAIESWGIRLYGCSDSVVVENALTQCYYGIDVSGSSNNTIYHNNLVNITYPVYSWNPDNIWDDGYPSGGNYWSDFAGVDLNHGPNQNIAGSDGIGDSPYIIYVDNSDRYPLMEPYSPGNLSVSVYTDEDTYSVGETLHLGLNVTNPDSVKYLCFALWCWLPDSTVHLEAHQHSVVLPIGLEYSDPSFKTFTLPSLPTGTYTWHMALLDRATHTILVHDTAEWEFS